jgi:hypothetical protein
MMDTPKTLGPLLRAELARRRNERPARQWFSHDAQRATAERLLAEVGATRGEIVEQAEATLPKLLGAGR